MIEAIVEFILKFFVKLVGRQVISHLEKSVEAKALKIYLKGVRGLRLLVVGGFILTFFFQMMIFGLMAFLAAVIWWCPFSFEAKLLILVCLSAVFFFVPLAVVLYLLSERFWFQFSGGKKMYDDLHS